MKFITIFDPKNDINFIKRFKQAGVIAFLVPVAAILGLIFLGLNWGIDFSGGMELQVKFQKDIPAAEIRKVLLDLDFEKNQVQQFGALENHEMLIRVERASMMQTKDVDRISDLLKNTFPNETKIKAGHPLLLFDEKSGNQLSIWLMQPFSQEEADHQLIKTSLENQRLAVLNLLNEKGGIELRKSKTSHDAKADINDAVLADPPSYGMVRYTVQFGGISNKIQKELEKRFGAIEIRRVDFVDSQVSHQLRTDGILALIYALIAIAIYIAIRFDFFFAPGAIIALIYDTMAALCVFVYARVEFDTPSIAALLTIIGYSINNTVVIYDRIRETVPVKNKHSLSAEELKPYINKAINDTLSRTINTTLTTLFASVILWIFSTGSIANFAMVLTIGVAFGAFTSVFTAPAAYLLAKKYLKPAEHDSEDQSNKGFSREDKAKGVV